MNSGTRTDQPRFLHGKLAGGEPQSSLAAVRGCVARTLSRRLDRARRGLSGLSTARFHERTVGRAAPHHGNETPGSVGPARGHSASSSWPDCWRCFWWWGPAWSATPSPAKVPNRPSFGTSVTSEQFIRSSIPPTLRDGGTHSSGGNHGNSAVTTILLLNITEREIEAIPWWPPYPALVSC